MTPNWNNGQIVYRNITEANWRRFMNNKFGNMQAFPRPMGGYLTDVGHQFTSGNVGMTYRQWLVGMALQGLLSNQTFIGGADEAAEAMNVSPREVISKSAIQAADAVLAELAKE